MIISITSKKSDNPTDICCWIIRFGGDEEIRTLDLTDANRTLSQLSYAPTFRAKDILSIPLCIVKRNV